MMETWTMISNDEFEHQAFCFVFYNLLSLKQKNLLLFSLHHVLVYLVFLILYFTCIFHAKMRWIPFYNHAAWHNEQVLGYKSYSEFALNGNMASSPEVVLSFLHEMSKMVRPMAEEVWRYSSSAYITLILVPIFYFPLWIVGFSFRSLRRFQVLRGKELANQLNTWSHGTSHTSQEWWSPLLTIWITQLIALTLSYNSCSAANYAYILWCI